MSAAAASTSPSGGGSSAAAGSAGAGTGASAPDPSLIARPLDAVASVFATLPPAIAPLHPHRYPKPTANANAGGQQPLSGEVPVDWGIPLLFGRGLQLSGDGHRSIPCINEIDANTLPPNSLVRLRCMVHTDSIRRVGRPCLPAQSHVVDC
jgi:hypothetical protein